MKDVSRELDLLGPLWNGGEVVESSCLSVAEGRLQSLNRGTGAGRGRTHCLRPGWLWLAGLADVHVHLTRQEDLDQAVSTGVFFVRDMGSRDGRGLVLRDGCRVQTAGRAIVPSSGYGRFLGVPVGGRAEAEAAIQNVKSSGADFVKLVGSGLVDFREPGRIGAGGFSPDEIGDLIILCRRHGMKVSVHANGDAAVRAAVLHGADSIEHGFFMSDDTRRLMAERRIFWVPTVHAVAWRLDLSEENFSGSWTRIAVEHAVESHLEGLCKARDQGVRLALGTDAGSPGVVFGDSVLKEMDLWRRAGLHLSDILSSVTSNAFSLMGVDDEGLREGAPLTVVALGHEASFKTVPLFYEGRVLNIPETVAEPLPEEGMKQNRHA